MNITINYFFFPSLSSLYLLSIIPSLFAFFLHIYLYHSPHKCSNRNINHKKSHNLRTSKSKKIVTKPLNLPKNIVVHGSKPPRGAVCIINWFIWIPAVPCRTFPIFQNCMYMQFHQCSNRKINH